MRRVALLVVVLLTLGTAGCTVKQPPHVPPTPARPVDMAVFLRSDATEQQKQAIIQQLHAIPAASGVRFETREQAYQRFKEQFKDQPDLLGSVRPDSLPESFRFTVTDRTTADVLIVRLRTLPGVDDVQAFPSVTPSPPR